MISYRMVRKLGSLSSRVVQGCEEQRDLSHFTAATGHLQG